jgi:hypothetical protein
VAGKEEHMPYYVHRLNTEPIDHPAYETKAEALARRQDGETVSFVPTEVEAGNWRVREQARFTDGTYTHVPWSSAEWYANYKGLHYAHLSLQFPGLIAYTPDETWGHEDRQLRTTAGKYLAKFAADQSSVDCQRWIDAVKAHATGVRFTSDPDEIERVYRCGPSSCMSRPFVNNIVSEHPSRVYGLSPDLAVAYIGELSILSGLSDVSQRCIVWPDRHIYSRIYGSGPLDTLLTQMGYHPDSLHGARVRAIRNRAANWSNDSWIMPYIDGCGSADREGEWFVLCRDGSGAYNVQVTHGYTGDAPAAEEEDEEEDEEEYEQEALICSRDGCGRYRDHDREYCDRCEDMLWTCAGCEEDHFEDPAASFHTGGTGLIRSYCASCAEDRRVSCAIDGCTNMFFAAQFSSIERNDRYARHVESLCPTCAANFEWCAWCHYVGRDSAHHHVRCPSRLVLA